jgi:Tol biopolymer transport system component
VNGRVFRRAALVLGLCFSVLVVGAFAFVWTASRAVEDFFYDEPHGSIYVYSIDSGQLEKIADQAAFSLAWTAEGQELWFTDASQPGGSHSVRAIDVGSRAERELFDIGSGGYVTMSPAAGLVAFARGAQAPLSVHVVGLDGAQTTFDDANHPRLTSDGVKLTFVRPSCGVPPTFYDSDPRVPQSAQPAIDETTALSVEPDGPYSLSPDGRYLTYWKDDYSEIYLRDLTTGVEFNLGAGFPAEAWAPDSSRFVFMHRPDGFGAYETPVLRFVNTADGTVIDEIDLSLIETHLEISDPPVNADDQELVRAVAWSPDGASLAIGVAGGGTLYPPCGT